MREEWLRHARGEVLEVGSGLNLPYYPPEVQRVYGVDPSLELRRMAAKRAATTHAQVELLSQSAEESLPLADGTIDTVITTWTLCSIPNPSQALQQMKRVLKESGCLVFVEHGRSPDRQTVVWQDRITSVWKRITGGCHPNRKIDELITVARFKIVELKTFYQPGSHPMMYTYQGIAEPYHR